MSAIPSGAAAPLATLWYQRSSQVLGGAAASVSFTGLSDKLYRVSGVLLHTAAGILTAVRVNNDSGNNYAGTIIYGQPTNVQGGSALTAVDRWYPQTSSNTNDAADNPLAFQHIFAKPMTTQRGRGLGMVTMQDASGVTGPWPFSGMMKWGNTADLITRIDIIAGSSTYKASSHVTVEGML